MEFKVGDIVVSPKFASESWPRFAVAPLRPLRTREIFGVITKINTDLIDVKNLHKNVTISYPHNILSLATPLEIIKLKKNNLLE